MQKIQNIKKYNIVYCILLIVSCNNINHKTESDNISYRTLFDRANYYYDNHNFIKAVGSLDSLIALDSLNGELFFKRAYSKSMLPDIISAQQDYKKAIRFNYRKKSAYLNMGVLFASIGQCDSAIAYLNECLKIEPENSKANQMKNACIEANFNGQKPK